MFYLCSCPSEWLSTRHVLFPNQKSVQVHTSQLLKHSSGLAIPQTWSIIKSVHSKLLQLQGIEKPVNLFIPLIMSSFGTIQNTSYYSFLSSLLSSGFPLLLQSKSSFHYFPLSSIFYSFWNFSCCCSRTKEGKKNIKEIKGKNPPKRAWISSQTALGLSLH